ncbi:hypothetical protein HU200_025660 [Digitaria exilis]|uniref:Uncharacterized protein n=1 Tax=Digitaria exilis TaxID=1010633 RepID=A0A835ESL7_9POAL|nr:hypothetical protein HU200_025660 [Digitaria exilis]
MWFLDALRGLASISHILLEDALEALSHTHPKESLSEYAFNNDVKKMRREFNLVQPTIQKGVQVTKSFLGLMLARRQRVLEKACSK